VLAHVIEKHDLEHTYSGYANRGALSSLVGLLAAAETDGTSCLLARVCSKRL
jgi:hypothetical protein